MLIINSSLIKKDEKKKLQPFLKLFRLVSLLLLFVVFIHHPVYKRRLMVLRRSSCVN